VLLSLCTSLHIRSTDNYDIVMRQCKSYDVHHYISHVNETYEECQPSADEDAVYDTIQWMISLLSINFFCDINYIPLISLPTLLIDIYIASYWY
jgi:hypothetical protein